MVKCANCAHEMADNASFCPKCGVKVSPQTETPGRRTPASQRLVYPRNPPLSRHIALIGIFLPGVPQLIIGQQLKGVMLLLAAFIAAGLAGPFGYLGAAAVAVVDAYLISGKLERGRPVGAMEFF